MGLCSRARGAEVRDTIPEEELAVTVDVGAPDTVAGKELLDVRASNLRI